MHACAKPMIMRFAHACKVTFQVTLIKRFAVKIEDFKCMVTDAPSGQRVTIMREAHACM